ncbi:MAG: hypothetical protein JWO13_2067 [Acidobacteriales bacterium]|nr:hypothetical protein [Terriglobales bacterium]
MLSVVGILLLFTSCGGSNGVSPSGNPIPPIISPSNPTVQPKFAYTTNQASASISGYAVNPTTGALTLLSGFPIPSGVNPYTIAVDKLGHFVFAGDIFQNVLHVYSINASSGMLQETASSPYPAGNQPSSLAVPPFQ